MANRFQYQITATDQSAKGVKSAEKRLDGLTKGVNRYGQAGKRAETERRSGILKTSGALEQAKFAAGQLSGMAPGLSRYGSVLGGVQRAASSAAGGVKAAAQSGSMLSSALGGVVAIGGAAVGVTAALAAGAVKLAAGWAEGGAHFPACRSPSGSPRAICRSCKPWASSSGSARNRPPGRWAGSPGRSTMRSTAATPRPRASWAPGAWA